MDKKAIVKAYTELLVELGEQAKDVVLSAGAALVMMGIRESTADLDVDVLPNVFKILGKKKGVELEDGSFTMIHYSDHVHIHELDTLTGRVCIEGVWCYSPGEMLTQKRYLVNHPKRNPNKLEQDRKDIEGLEALVKGPVKFTARVV